MNPKQLPTDAATQDSVAAFEQIEAKVGAWVEYDPKQIAAAARTASQQPDQSALSGRLIGIKDIIEAEGFHTGYGSSIYADAAPRHDAAAVALIRRASGIILGKTVTAEFAFLAPGKTANPHDLTRTPGGSSSGSAAAVASGMVPIALGTQTAASITRPASYCGVVGFKPTFGTYSLAGVKTLAHSLDTLGVLARSVDDVTRMHGVLSQSPNENVASVLPRIGVCRTPAWDKAEVSTVRAIEGAIALLRNAGTEVSDITLPAAFDELAEVQSLIMAYEAARNLAYENMHYRDRLSVPLRALIDRGASLTREQYATAQRRAAEARLHCADMFRSCDVIMAPAAMGEAPHGLGATGDPIFNRMWTLLRLPTICLPGFKGENQMPVGVQFLGPLYEDWALLKHAAWIEAKFADVLSDPSSLRTAGR